MITPSSFVSIMARLKLKSTNYFHYPLSIFKLIQATDLDRGMSLFGRTISQLSILIQSPRP